MECIQMTRLWKDYTAANVTFEGARARLPRRVGNCPTSSELKMLCDELERLWDESERARAALDAHIQEHCCMVPNPANLHPTCRSRFTAML
jgi:hypothetical protein